MRISDWSSDVCSSDLYHDIGRVHGVLGNLPLGIGNIVFGTFGALDECREPDRQKIQQSLFRPAEGRSQFDTVMNRDEAGCPGADIDQASLRRQKKLRGQIGRASSRVKVCQYV